MTSARNDLDQQHVLVTGGAGDIGTAIAVALASRGATITLADLKPEAEATDALTAVPDAAYRQLDVRSHADVRALVDELAPLDAVVGSHGIVRSSPFATIDPADWQAQLDVNLTGSFNLGQAVAQRWLRESRAGAIVFVGSWVQEVPWPEIAAYSASKAGLAMLARSMARELGASGIRVNVVAPGIVDAGMARQQAQTEPQYAARIQGIVPLGRLQTVEEVADATAYLCSPSASYVTGSTLLVDGGASLFQFDSQ
jgi:NAD(P)-dependent dehydrogenase (short-subunit alcohol dehydrogenase family)